MSQVSKTGWVGLLAVLASVPTVAAAHDGSSHGSRPVVLLPAPPKPPGELQITNEFDGEVEVILDGRYVGRIAGHGKLRMPAANMVHDVLVRRPDTKFVMMHQDVRVYGDALKAVYVRPPTAMLRVENDGEVALRIDIDDTDVWLSPGSSVQVPVLAGNVDIHASMKEPRGEWLAVDRTMWVEPGQRGASTSLRPDPTVIVISNRENFAVHALFDGKDAGWLDPGESRRVWVKPGPTHVVLLDRNGRVRETTQVTVARGKEVKVVVQPAFQVVNTVVTTGHDHGAHPNVGHSSTCNHR